MGVCLIMNARSCSSPTGPPRKAGEDPLILYEYEYVYVPPQINQFARLNCCFVVKDDASPKAAQTPPHPHWRPVTEWDTGETNPIWGWAALNAPDNGIQLFRADGGFDRTVSIWRF